MGLARGWLAGLHGRLAGFLLIWMPFLRQSFFNWHPLDTPDCECLTTLHFFHTISRTCVLRTARCVSPLPAALLAMMPPQHRQHRSLGDARYVAALDS